MPRPFHHAFNNWLSEHIRLRYILLALVVVAAALWAADTLGWLPVPAPVESVQLRPGY